MGRLFNLMFVAFVLLPPALASAQDKFFDSNGVRIRYVDQGVGQPIVLIHGFTGDVETSWVKPGVLGNLAKDHRVIAFDVRGRGKSDKPRDPKLYGKEVAQDVVRLLDHLKIQRAHIVGYSMGAMITAKLVTTHPERFLTATLGGAAGRRNWTAEDDRAAQAEAVEFEKGTPFRSVILRTWPVDQPRPSDETIRQLSQERINRGNDPAAFAADMRGRRELAVKDKQLAAVRIPILGVVGSLDANLKAVNDLKSILPSITVIVVDGATHGGERGVPQRPEFVSAIREYIRINSQRSSR
jgi:pimeloyl-ACP methyl ester carboxylesterase